MRSPASRRLTEHTRAGSRLVCVHHGRATGPPHRLQGHGGARHHAAPLHLFLRDPPLRVNFGRSRLGARRNVHRHRRMGDSRDGYRRQGHDYQDVASRQVHAERRGAPRVRQGREQTPSTPFPRRSQQRGRSTSVGGSPRAGTPRTRAAELVHPSAVHGPVLPEVRRQLRGPRAAGQRRVQPMERRRPHGNLQRSRRLARRRVAEGDVPRRGPRHGHVRLLQQLRHGGGDVHGEPAGRPGPRVRTRRQLPMPSAQEPRSIPHGQIRRQDVRRVHNQVRPRR